MFVIEVLLEAQICQVTFFLYSLCVCVHSYMVPPPPM